MAKHDNTLETLFEHGLDVRRRRVYVHGELGGEDVTSYDAVRALNYLDHNPGPIEIWINTPGGAIEEEFGLYDVIRGLKSQITTVGFGMVCSAGVLLLAAGDKRVALSNCWMMSHDFGTWHDGEGYAVEDRMAAEKRMRKRWAELLAGHTEKTAEWWLSEHKARHRELWLNANQMLAHGIIDEIRD